MSERDRRRIRRALKDWAASGSFVGLRTRAIVELAMSSALRLKECCALNTAQILEEPGRLSIRTVAYLRAPQSKGRRQGVGQRWDSAGSFMLASAARAALRTYLAEAKRREWMAWPPKPDDPLFIGVRARGVSGHGRVSHRIVQHQFLRLQRELGIPEPYMFHELRHDALTRFASAAGGNPYKLAAYGRCHIKTATRYVHTSPIALSQLAELAARSA